MPRYGPVATFELIVLSDFPTTSLRATARDSQDWQLRRSPRSAYLHAATGADGEPWMFESADVHGIFAQVAESASLRTAVQIEDTDFLLAIWTRDTKSVAQREDI